MKKFRAFCSPTQVYVVISFFSILALLSQNMTSPHKYAVGKYSCDLEHHNMFFFLFKIIYVFAWTFILQELCKHGYKSISWFLVLLPFILFFVIIGLFLVFNIFK